MRTEQTMMRIFEDLETIGHKIIDKVGNAAIGVAKAVVTVVCLGASLSYRAGQNLGQKFYKASQPGANVDTVQKTNAPVNDDRQVVEQGQQMGDVPVLEDTKVESEIILADNYDALDSAVIATDKILSIIETINLVKPIAQENSLAQFVQQGLRDELSREYISLVSYTLPRNKRTKKAYRRHGNFGVLVEHYETVEKLGLLT